MKQGWTSRVVFLTFLMTWACAEAPKRSVTPEQRAKLLLEIAIGALQEGDAIDALERLFEAQALAPELPEIHHTKALAYLKKNDPENAAIAAKKAVELAPQFSDALTTLGKILLDQGQLAEAAGYLRRAAQDPIYRGAYKAKTHLGIIAYRRADYEGARRYLDEAIRDAPQQACVAKYYRGHLALQKGEYTKAIRDYREATVRQCGRFTDAHYALGVALSRNRNFDLARKKFLEVTQLDPESPVAEKAKERLRYLP